MASQTRHLHIGAQNNTISFIQQNLNLPLCNIYDEILDVKDAVFISIDFENVHKFKENPYKPGLKTQMRVFILDTQRVGTSSTKRILKTYNFTIGVRRDREDAFLFGRTQQTTVKQLISNLENLIDRKRNKSFLHMIYVANSQF